MWYYGGSEAEDLSAHISLDGAYELLGLTPTASTKEIKQAFRARARESHPDNAIAAGLGQEAIEELCNKFRMLQDAYSQIVQSRAHF